MARLRKGVREALLPLTPVPCEHVDSPSPLEIHGEEKCEFFVDLSKIVLSYCTGICGGPCPLKSSNRATMGEFGLSLLAPTRYLK